MEVGIYPALVATCTRASAGAAKDDDDRGNTVGAGGRGGGGDGGAASFDRACLLAWSKSSCPKMKKDNKHLEVAFLPNHTNIILFKFVGNIGSCRIKSDRSLMVLSDRSDLITPQRQGQGITQPRAFCFAELSKL